MSWLRFIPTVLQAFGSFAGGQNDARALRRQAAVAREQALRDEEAQRREARQVLGMQAAAMAQAGGGIDEGLLRQSAVLAELDALNIRYRGAMESQGLLSQAKAAKREGIWQAGTTLLSGAADAYLQGRRLKG